ncbi:MAG: holo-ACP synthase [Lachnospiraceae bacterium]|nr:holo-[acyl-carrier-protein] synthase [Lachnospira sp.]MBR6697315.1 holo-ACP synthase [Lachnospiraceae bacterium]
MILGLGNDIIEIQRVKRACNTAGFLTRCFTNKELECFGENYTSLAGNYAVKEAVAKAFGTGFRSFGLIDIEVLRDELGKPYVCLYGKALEMKNEMQVDNIHISISNLKDLVSAVAILERS